MSENQTLLFACLDDGCEIEIEGADEGSLVTAVNEHMGTAHSTFELDEVILTNSTVRETEG